MKTENLGHKSFKEGRNYMDLLQSSSVSHDKIPGPKGLGLYVRKFLCVKCMDSQGDPQLGSSHVLWDVACAVYLASWFLQLCLTLFSGKPCFLQLVLHHHCLFGSFWSPTEAFYNLCFYWTLCLLHWRFSFTSHYIFLFVCPLSITQHTPDAFVRMCCMSDH